MVTYFLSSGSLVVIYFMLSLCQPENSTVLKLSFVIIILCVKFNGNIFHAVSLCRPENSTI